MNTSRNRFVLALVLAACFCLAALLLSFAAVGPIYVRFRFGNRVGCLGFSVPDVAVTLTNVANDRKQTITTGGDGSYTFVNVVPGQYLLEADKAGFKHVKREGVIVQVQHGVRIDIGMEVGAVSQTVEVTARRRCCSPTPPLSVR